VGAAVGAAAALPADAGVEIASDALLKVSFAVSADAAAETKLTLTLSALTPAGLRNVSLQLEPPPTLAMSLTGPPTAEVRGSRVGMAALLAQSSCAVCASITARAPAAAAEQRLLGQLTYMEAMSADARVLSFTLPISPSDMLRPLPLATPQFGQIWPTHAAEKKTVVYSSLNPASYMSMLARSAHLHPVDTIGVECIAAGKLVGSDHALLVHTKLGLMAGRALELTVRSREPRLSEAVHRQLVELLSSS